LLGGVITGVPPAPGLRRGVVEHLMGMCETVRYTDLMEPSAPVIAVVFWVVLAVLVLAASAWFLLRDLRQRAARAERAAQAEFVSSMAQQQQEVDLLRNQVRAAESRLREVIDAIPAGVAIYDNQDRLLGFNREVARQYPYCGEGPVIGEAYEALMRRALTAGCIPDAMGREEEWLAVRMAGRGALGAPLLRHADDGQWVHFYETRTPSGYLVMTRLDITPLVEKGLALERANEQLLRLSTTDGLTGIGNRRLFDQTLQGEWQRCARNQSALSLLMIDIDHFRRYNKHYGHQTGDECLRQVTRVLAGCVKRSGELVARFDGAEFVVLLPGVDGIEARRVAERCLQQMAGARIPHADSPVAPWLTLSIGLASRVPAPRVASATLVEAAKQALTRAKHTGRARLEVFDAEPVSAPASQPAAL